MARGPAFARRPFLAGAALLALLGTLPATARARAVHVATAGRPEGGYLARVLDADGATLASVALPERGHGNATTPDGTEVVVFARRPGTHATVIGIADGAVHRIIRSPAGRHFYGHGAFAPDGSLMFATENDVAGGRGVLGVYDVAAGYRRIGEVPAHGIGPHQVQRRGERLFVAVGGILTRPDTGRRKLNIDTMTPSLTILDAADGRLVGQQGLPHALHRLSLRHLSTAPDGTVAIGGQWQDDDAPPDVPLVWVAPPGETLAPLSFPEPATASLRGYVGSIEFDREGRYLAVTSPVGGRIVVWDMRAGRIAASRAITDVCGLAPEPAGGFRALTGTGAIWHVDPARGEARPLARPGDERLMWDNHAGLLLR